MKFTKVLACIPIAFVLMVLYPAVLSAGELEPSSPPSSGTMKTLDEVEPRIPISGSDEPVSTFQIDGSGSYYLTGNRVCSGTGIYLGSGVGNVTIDLCGYTLSAEDGSTGTGILMQSCSNVAVLNGTITGFSLRGIAEFNRTGTGKGHKISGVTISGTGPGYPTFDALSLTGSEHLVENCIIRDNSNDGILIMGGGTVRNNTVVNNADKGIVAYNRNIVTGNRCCLNGDSGIVSYGASIIKDNVSCSNDEYGIHTNADGCRIEGNVVSSNQVYGIYASDNCCIKGNTANENGTGGIHGAQNCLFVDNVACSNTSYGIHCSGNGYIDSNAAVDNGISNIYTDSSSTVGTNHAP
ncbi:hypothetical protein L21SP3_01103 [Sedimentisphaera cyanobacteriorum]|uniref:Right handed beta helix domain-containing protein n=1 Tax=Sedimentisphaera cyanobacteriorum TaxID=1940790 RepID=A0A1Q2HPJ9_9BACT|nr:right-handed parallel beta-helix repeat-containing protein [Sedimentisphaera cyanobacteriorum]AQQ09300.1 hypothetical protein L21SP3_01103 [Sedimentisphaera cyanobacteriorum]